MEATCTVILWLVALLYRLSARRLFDSDLKRPEPTRVEW